MNLKQLFTFFIIVMMLIPSVYAGDTKTVGDEKGIVENPTSEKVTDKTKEKATEITSKDAAIKGKITVTDTDVTKYRVSKKSSTEISITKQEAKDEHTEAKVVIPKSELDKIDIDKDGKFGILRVGDNGEILGHDVLTTAQLVAGAEMTFTTNIVNGYSGHKAYTFNNVTSGQTLNIDDVSGNYTIGVAADGAVPTYTAGIPTNGLWAHYTFDGNANDSSGNDNNGTPHNLTFADGAAVFNNIDSYISIPSVEVNESYTIIADIHEVNFLDDNTIISQGKVAWAIPSNGFWIGTDRNSVGDTDTPEARGYTTPTVDRVTNTYMYNGSSLISYQNGVQRAAVNTTEVPYIGQMDNNAAIGKYSNANMHYFNGELYDLIIYSIKLNDSARIAAYAGGSGISFKPSPSYNWTGYNVASGVEKVLNTDSTTTGIEYVDTTGGTHNVTVNVYFTEDTTLISDTHTSTLQTVNISHTALNTAQDGALIPYEVQPEYFGTLGFDTTNNNATISRNATHFIVDTGYIKNATTYYYNVSIPNYLESMIWTYSNPNNETCNGIVTISNSTPYTTWTFNLTNVTTSNTYFLRYPNNTEISQGTAANGYAIITALGLSDGTYWITESSGFQNIHFVVGIAFVGATFVLAAGAFDRKRRKKN